MEKSTKAWLYSFLRPLRQTLHEVVALSVFINILALALPIITLQIYDRVISHNGFSTLQGLVVGTVFIVLFDFFLRQGRSRILQNVALRIEVYVSQKLFSKFMSLPIKTLESQPSAYWLLLFKDSDTIRHILSGKSAILIADLPFILFYLIMIFVIAKPVAWVFLVILPIFMFFVWYAVNGVAPADNAEQKTAQTRSLLVLEMINARNTIKTMSLETVMVPLWEDVQAKNIEASVKQRTKIDNFYNLGTCLIKSAFLFLITVGAMAIISQELTIGVLVATCMLGSQIFDPLGQFISNIKNYHSFRQSVARLSELFNSVSERQESTISINKPNGEITLENISFSYSHELPNVINNVEFTFKAIGVHALVGFNGSGKSTLLRLIKGLYKPTSGRILIDGADISHFSRRELSTWMGFVPQDCILFSGTIRDNIACHQSSISDDEVLRVAKAVGLHQFIVDMPDGYSTEIGEAGCRLSCGERQRVAIARALVGDPPVLLLDEPSSNLDLQSELELGSILKTIGKERTVIVVSHRSALLACCDDFVALNKGRICDAGSSMDILPEHYGSVVEHVRGEPHQKVKTEEFETNKKSFTQDISQARTRTNVPKQQNKLVAVREVKPSTKNPPIFSRSLNEKQEMLSKSNLDSTNSPKSPDKKGGK